MAKHISALTGEPIDFKHNNMTPFFGPRILQNTSEGANEVLLSAHTGVSAFDVPKTEVRSFADVNQHVAPASVPFYVNTTDHYEPGRMRPDERPIESVIVGQGSRESDPVLPSGGFNQEEYREAYKYKSVDELRVTGNPKQTFEGRTVAGKGIDNRTGDTGTMEKRLATDVFRTTCADDMLPTSGVSAVTGRSRPIDRDTNRKVSTPYTGVANKNVGDRVDGKFRVTSKPTLRAYAMGNADRQQATGVGDRDDYGRANVVMYDTGRQALTANRHKGNVGTLVKAMVAPLADTFRSTNKEYTVAPAREFGPMQSLVKKQTVHDTNDVTRTTVKETLIHDTRTGNLRSFEKTTVYDPNDVARTTIKETNIHDTRTGPLATKPSTYVNNKDPTKVTVRDTLGEYDKTANMSGHVKATVYNPKDVMRTTVKETLVDDGHLGGVDTAQNASGYLTANPRAKTTNKQITSDNAYHGNPERENGDGYLNTKVYAPNTNKQFTSDHEHFGLAGPDVASGTSYESVYNAIINATREGTLENPVPTATGPKQVVGGEGVHLTSTPVRQSTPAPNLLDSVRQTIPSKHMVGSLSSQSPPSVQDCDRNDPGLLDAFRNNPYTQSLSSHA